MSTKENERHKIITDLYDGTSTNTQAAAQLGLSVRQVQRCKKRLRDDGAAGLVHGNRGRESNRKLSAETTERAIEIVREQYPDFGPTLAAEKLEKVHGLTLGRETLRGLMAEAGIRRPKPKKKTPQYRAWRPRKEYYGEMQQFDGSHHDWFEGRAPRCCLLVSVDDATGRITRAGFRENESAVNVFGFWWNYVEMHGKPPVIYLDRSSTHKINHHTAEDRQELITQFERAARELDVKFTFAWSPQGKGRIERLFGTLQDRLVKEMRLRGISDPETANQYLRDTFLPWFNEQFSVVSTKAGDVHRVLPESQREQLPAIFSIQGTRQVQNDFTIQFKNRWYQLEKTQPVTVCRKDRVVVEERLDGSVCLRFKEAYLAYTSLPERPQRSRDIRRAPVLTTAPPPRRGTAAPVRGISSAVRKPKRAAADKKQEEPLSV